MRIDPRANRKLVMTARAASCAVLLALAGAFVLVFNLARAAAQPAGGNSAKGFYSPLDYFPAPHELQMRSCLEGSESEMGPNSTIIIQNAKMQTFHEDGSKEMIMSAPHCIYDYGSHIAHSDGPIKMQMWDEDNKHAYQVLGTNGFYWQQTNSYIIVSNGQITTISGALTNTFNP